MALDGAGHETPARWITGMEADATSPAVAMAPDGSAVVAWVHGMPTGLVTAVTVAPDGTAGAPQTVSAEPGGAPEVAIGPDGTALLAWPSDAGSQAAVRRPGESRFSAPTAFPAAQRVGLGAAVTRRGEAIVAFLDAGDTTEPRDGARLYAAAAPAGGGFGAPVMLADGAYGVAVAGDEVTWTDSRPLGELEAERRVRTARLSAAATTPGPAGGGGPDGRRGDRRKPRVTVRVLRAHGRHVRIRVRANERATVRATWRHAGRGRALHRSRARLRAHRARVIRYRAPAKLRRVAVTIEVSDRAGNTRTLRRRIRLPRR